MLDAENNTRNHEARDCNWRYGSEHSSWIHPYADIHLCVQILRWQVGNKEAIRNQVKGFVYLLQEQNNEQRQALNNHPNFAIFV